jgi:AAA15 family ATPase/GTPase
MLSHPGKRCVPAHWRLRAFHNSVRFDADFALGFYLLLGDNAPSKTNILEAANLNAQSIEENLLGVPPFSSIKHVKTTRPNIFQLSN